MRLRAKPGAFVMLLLSVLVSGYLWAANRENSVKVEGNELSVYSKGVPLGKLLTAVESKTGVNIRFDELMTEKKVFVDFEGLSLLEGIKKIIFPLNCAAIYDDTDKLRKVIILERWKASEMKVPRGGGNRSPEGPKPGPSDSISLTTKGSSDSSGASKGPPLEKGPVYLDGPSVDSAYSGGRGPNTQEKIPEDLPVPSVAGSVHLPIPDSKGASVEVPPVGKAASGSTPPDSQDEIPENLPIPGVAASDHLPIPGY